MVKIKGIPSTWEDLYIHSLTAEQIKSLMPSVYDNLLKERLSMLEAK